MPKAVSWGNVVASKDGEGGNRLPAGPYVCRITEMIDNLQKEYVEVVYDIAEGEYANQYADDWGKSHPFAHHFFLSYKSDKALSMTKGRLEAIQESNPGFDPFAAWDGNRLDMFVGRIVGLNLQDEEYEYQGEVKTRTNVCQVVPAQDVRDGKVKTRDKKTLDKGGSAASAGQTVTAASIAASVANGEVYSGDIPFA